MPDWGKCFVFALLTVFSAICTRLFRIWPPGITLDIREDCAKRGVRLEPTFDRYKVDNNLYPIAVHCNAVDDIVPPWVNVVYVLHLAVTVVLALFTLYYLYRTVQNLTIGRKHS